MTPYIIIGSKDIQSLVDTVNTQITNGYQPLGGLSVTADASSESGFLFSQAMLLSAVPLVEDDE